MRISKLSNVCSPEKQNRIHEFCEWCCEKLGINTPLLHLKPHNDTSALGYTNMDNGSVTIVVGDRHQMDIMRTLAHELVHCKQMESYTPNGATGSDDENEANAMAGVLMREWGQQNPDLYTEEYQMDEARQKMSAQDRLDRRAAKHGIGTPDKEKFYADMKKKFQQSLDRKNESVEAELEESKTARMMALITALGAAYGLEDDAREFAYKIQQNIDNAQNAEPNPGRPDPVRPGNLVPGSDRVMRPPVKEMGAGSIAMAIGGNTRDKKNRNTSEKAVSKSQQRFFGMVDALKKGEKVKGATADMRKAAKDMSTKDVKDFARTKHKGLPNKVSEAVNVQAIKDEVIGAVRSGNPREMKRVDDTIAKRISDLMDLRGTAGKEVDAQIMDALPILKKAQMYLRDKIKMTEEAKKDACYNKVRSRYKVWPSAYASGALVQCRKKGAANWGNKSKK